MFCNKCGKEIEKGMLCNECLVAELVSVDTAKQEPAKEMPAEAPVTAAPIVETPVQPTVTNPTNMDTAGNFTFFHEPTMTQGAPQSTVPNMNMNTMPEPNNRMYGFGKALTSTILAFIGYILVYAGLMVAIEEPAGGVVLSLLSIPLIIVPLILGIASIKVFQARKKTCKKPIPTLVLGIVGTACAGGTALMAIICFFCSVILLAV